MPFQIIRNDITKVQADAIVNTANPHPIIGSGTDSAIHEAAGPELLSVRKKIGDIPPGGATPGAIAYQILNSEESLVAIFDTMYGRYCRVK